MLLNKANLIIFIIIFGGFNQVWSKSHGHGHGHGGSRRASSSSSHSGIGSASSLRHHISNGNGHSNIHEKTWSSYSSDEHTNSATSEPITISPHVQDTVKYNPPDYNSSNDYKPFTYEHRAPALYLPQSLSVNELDDFITGYITGRVRKDSALTPSNNDNSFLNYQYSQPYQPPIVIPLTVENQLKGESKSKEDKQQEYDLKTYSHNFEFLNLKIPLLSISSTLRTHCQQHLHSEFNEHGEIVDSVREICKPLTPKTTTPFPTTSTLTATTEKTMETPSAPQSKPYALKEKRYERISTSTPRGINCRKVMNSELNERGEIVDSVTEVCDPPTTTTTTTRKPTVMTTTRRPLTSPKPLVRVCRRVMDSYLNEAGEIIDSVTEVCTMEPIDKI